MIYEVTILEKRDKLIKSWLKEAAKKIEKSLQSKLTVNTKSDRNDLVTQVDWNIEKYLVQKIHEHFPKDRIVSEEGYGDTVETIDKDKDTIWYLDPIDGTLNFVLQKENFAIMLAVYEENIGQQAYIYNVMTDELYWSIKNQGVFCNQQQLEEINNVSLKDGLFASNSSFISKEQVNLNAQITKKSMGVRTMGSAAMEVIELLKGNTVAYLSYGLHAWDIAAGYMMIHEIGGAVRRLDGLPIDFLDPRASIMGTHQAIKDIQNYYN